ncbi:MAG TPA: Sec-independent protein translocase protein TatB [Xanthomonadaceae bacterium]|nr:Sec-independent protein translocase protein TatB [Xanthomonadaceae bacterium]
MFDIGFGELLLIAVVALVVLGPERLPKAARLAGLWIRKARTQWNSVKAELENELADEELRRNLRAASEALHDSVKQARALPDALRNDPLVMDAATTMTSLDPARSTGAQDAPMESASTSSLQDASASDASVADAPATSDAATQPDHDPAQMSLLDEKNPVFQMDLLPRAPWPHSDE